MESKDGTDALNSEIEAHMPKWSVVLNRICEEVKRRKEGGNSCGEP